MHTESGLEDNLVSGELGHQACWQTRECWLQGVQAFDALLYLYEGRQNRELRCKEIWWNFAEMFVEEQDIHIAAANLETRDPRNKVMAPVVEMSVVWQGLGE